MTSMKQAKKQKAIAYLLAHPDASKATAARETMLSVSTIARARQELVQKGLLAPFRDHEPSRVPDVPPALPEAVPPAAPSPPDGGSPTYPLTDDEAMRAMGAGIEEDLEDEEVQKRLMKQAQRFAFDPSLHPDTRMSASQLWAKLRDLKREKDLGPGKPLTFEEASGRMSEMMIATGPEVTSAGLEIAVKHWRGNEGELPTNQGEAQPSTDAAPEAPGGHPDVRTAEGPADGQS